MENKELKHTGRLEYEYRGYKIIQSQDKYTVIGIDNTISNEWIETLDKVKVRIDAFILNKEQPSKEILLPEQREILRRYISVLRSETIMAEGKGDTQDHEEAWDFLKEYFDKAIKATEASEAHAEELQKELDRVKEEKASWYEKLLKKLNEIADGERGLEEYISKVQYKIDTLTQTKQQ